MWLLSHGSHKGDRMKRLMVLMLVLVIFVGALAAFDQAAYVGLESNVSDLFDMRNPENLTVYMIPWAQYRFGDWSSPGLYGNVSVGSYYEIAEEFDTLLFPQLSSAVTYRIGIPNYDSIVNIGLKTDFFKDFDSDSTYLDNTLSAYFYPFDKATEVWTADPYTPYFDGFRIGFGIDAGAELANLLEETDISTRVHGALVGRVSGGAELYNRIWLQADLTTELPSFSFQIDNEEMNFSALAQGVVTLAYVGERFMLRGDLIPLISLNNLYTNDGFLSGASYYYSFTVRGEVEFEIINDLRLFGGVSARFGRGDADSVGAYAGLTYFFL